MKETTSIQTGYLCHCLRVTAERFEEILETETAPSYALLRDKYGVGTMCSSCEYEAKGVLNDYLLLHPGKAGRKAAKGLRADLWFAWRQLRERYLPSPATKQLRKESEAQLYHAGIFFLRGAGLESHLVISNLKFPEHAQNANGPEVKLRARLFGADGTVLGSSDVFAVADGASVELTARDLFPTLDGDFFGGLYLDFEELRQTGSLRPYGVLVDTTGATGARCHYHDKFGRFTDPGYFQNTAPLEPGERCWMALANCQELPCVAKAWLKAGGRKISVPVRIPAMASMWVAMEDLFPGLELSETERRSAIFWLDNPQHVMVYFFWYHEEVKTWMAQHH